jgi:hypothetical protein
VKAQGPRLSAGDLAASAVGLFCWRCRDGCIDGKRYRPGPHPIRCRVAIGSKYRLFRIHVAAHLESVLTAVAGGGRVWTPLDELGQPSTAISYQKNCTPSRNGMAILLVRHVTTYRYKRPVRLGEHRLMFRPRDSFDQRLLDSHLAVVPQPSRLRWIHELF